MSAEARVVELGLKLPPPPKPGGVYKPVVIVGNLCYVSGHGPLKDDGTMISGRVGADLDKEAGYQAARQVGLTILTTLRTQLGSLDRVKRVVKLLVFVNAIPGFTDQPKVANGASDLMVKVFGDKGKHARSAVGAGSLPLNVAVEVEAVFEVE